MFVNLVNFGAVTPEFNIAEYIHPVVSCFKLNFTDKLSQDPPDPFSPHLHHMVGILLQITGMTLIARGTLPWQPILG